MSTIAVEEKKVSFRTKFTEYSMMAFIAAFFVIDLAVCLKCGFLQFRQKAVVSLTVELFSIALCGFLYFSTLIDERRTVFRSLFLALIFFEAEAFFMDSIYWITAKNPSFNTLLIISNALLYLSGAVIFITFWGCEIQIMGLRGKMPEWLLHTMRVLMIIYIITVLLNIPFGFFYTIEDGVFDRTKYTSFLEFSLPVIVCCVLLFYAIKVKILFKIKITFICMAVLPLGAMILEHFCYISWFLYVSVLAATFILYIIVQVNLGHEIDKFRNKVMISQIQPHFMYNTLTTIKALCRVDPDLAAKTITNFADYLRGNMDFASLETTIPLEKELKHTRIYTEIEALRFDNITFEFKIEDENFEIPALVIQPMVENAVRHGVRSRKDGHILIHTYKAENYHIVVIKDNGKGFDNTQFNGSRTHIGLLNTRLRVERLVNGKFEVESIPDQGVTITIKIPIEK